MTGHPKAPQHRGGNVLVLFAFIVFAAMALAALVVDLGMARLTQLEMQTAADSAALGGMRYRDDLPAAWQPTGSNVPELPPGLVSNCGPQPSTTYDPTNPEWQQWIDAARRYTANQIVAVTFDDDFNPADGDTLQLGAGPVVDLSGGVGDSSMAAGELISLPSGSPVYKPNLQANPSNVAEGDLVAGAYGFNQSYQSANPTAVQDEAADYWRRDFVPNTSPGTVAETGFLARLRRSNENFSSATGVASNGPALPFLFGRGSMLARSSANAGDLTAASGITVRATAIAAAGTVSLGTQGNATSTIPVGHVLTVGPADTVDGIRGVAPFGLTATYWSSLNNAANANAGTDNPTVNPTTGVITSNLSPQNGATTNPNAIEAGVAGSAQAAVVTIGQLYSPAGSDSPLGVSPTLYTYVPIYNSIGTTPRTIVGFGFVQWKYVSGQISLSVPWSTANNAPADRIAAENASASLLASLPSQILQNSSASSLVQQLFDANQALGASLLAPVLVNRYFGPNFQP